MESFNVHLTRTTTETAVISMEADSHEEAVEMVLDQYHEGDYDDNFMHGDSDVVAEELGGNADDDLSPNTRVTKIQRLIAAGNYEEEEAVSDILADLRHYCNVKDIDFDNMDRRAQEHYLAELFDARLNEGKND